MCVINIVTHSVEHQLAAKSLESLFIITEYNLLSRICILTKHNVKMKMIFNKHL